LGGFGAQWWRALLDDWQRRDTFREMITGEMEAAVGLLLTAAESIRATKRTPTFELLRIDRTRDGYDQRRADVALIRPRELQHEVRAWYEALAMNRHGFRRREAAEEHYGSLGTQVTVSDEIAESDAAVWEDLAAWAVRLLHRLHKEPVPTDPLKGWRDRKEGASGEA
jgi:hypothetical protein